MTLKRFAQFVAMSLAAGVILSACQPFRNFTTYYNLFYNMERIMDEVEDSLLYMRETKIAEPSYTIPYDDALLQGARVYNHLDRRSMNAEEARANRVKLDSILIKGSKLLTRAPKSDYIDDAIFFMGKSFYYQREWFKSQKKAEELIANFPESKWLPDAHVVLAMAQLQQGDPVGAEVNLSRAIDVAWPRERRDVLIEAFRLNADVAMADGELDKALKPYQRALLLSSDGEERARWQYEIGVLYFRAGRFEDALKEFAKVEDHSPDILTQFETGLQSAVTHRVLKQTEKAEEELDDLADNNNFEPWHGLVALERLNLTSATTGQPIPDADLKQIDSLSPGKGWAPYGVYERAVRAFREGNYRAAFEGFQKVQSAQAPFQRKAQRMAVSLAYYFEYQNGINRLTHIPLDPWPDTTKAQVSDAYYNLARVFAAFALPDSVRHYYLLSDKWAPAGSPQAARAIYARSLMAREAGNDAAADSLLEILVADYSKTEYAEDARGRLGYTRFAMIDSAEDIYFSGVSHMRIGDNEQALLKFHQVIDGFRYSEYAPRAMYAIGLLFETKLENRDSAFTYYSQILNLYPRSEQAEEVRPLIDAVLAARVQQQMGVDPKDPSRGESLLQPDLLPEPVPNEGLVPLGGPAKVPPGGQPNNAVSTMPGKVGTEPVKVDPPKGGAGDQKKGKQQNGGAQQPGGQQPGGQQPGGGADWSVPPRK